MAACFLDAIVALQPEGPYLLAGVSVGGLIMLEVAILLSERGEKVALLALLDTYPHPRYWPVSCWIGMVLRRAKHHATALTEMPWRSAIPHLIKLSRAFFGHLRLRRGGSSLMFASVDMKISHRRRERAVQAWTNYRPRLYPGTITFLKAEIATRYPEDPRKVWNNVALKIDIHALPCDHIALITTHTEAVAACIERCIEDALTSTEYDAGQNRRPIMDRALS
jgi:thioesterase domain-containing protein